MGTWVPYHWPDNREGYCWRGSLGQGRGRWVDKARISLACPSRSDLGKSKADSLATHWFRTQLLPASCPEQRASPRANSCRYTSQSCTRLSDMDCPSRSRYRDDNRSAPQRSTCCKSFLRMEPATSTPPCLVSMSAPRIDTCPHLPTEHYSHPHFRRVGRWDCHSAEREFAPCCIRAIGSASSRPSAVACE